ncbi:hypothetical protein I312_102628 [Cryptococcus bacillisporus CA1280]|nr:complement component 1 Q subcomponent-binding protein, mitochondrial [Cryptococcus bacillisporus CA1280]KIR67283.1 complement component 1 Q subcomponent-binding protein, mitochondrial [Cryptococcus bacillisporus CA1873]|eukprot:KIR67283.1 complement component 1 Q subcomponent-binding protein, mitochondrial [Cryptococcus gattii CA1873]
MSLPLRTARPLLRASALTAARRIAIAPVLRPLSRAGDCGECGCVSNRAFSTTPLRFGSGETDGTLISALAAEHKYELESAAAQPEVPAFIESFKAQGVWNIEDTAGSDDVVLTRKFGNETLKLTFQVSDLDATAFDAEYPPAEEDSEAPASGPASITCSLVITKSAAPGALMVDLETCDEGFEITNVAVYDKALADAKGAEGDWERRSRYMGPQFDHLDETVQEAFGSYLAERGVDESLADFVLSYCEHKEQKDYVSWINQVRGFVEQ